MQNQHNTQQQPKPEPTHPPQAEPQPTQASQEQAQVPQAPPSEPQPQPHASDQDQWLSMQDQQPSHSEPNSQPSPFLATSQMQQMFPGMPAENIQATLVQISDIVNGQHQEQQQQGSQQWQQQSASQPIQPPQQQPTLGCQHYLRNCQVQAPCCKIYYTCKLCHDEKYIGPKAPGCKIQRMAFDQVENIRCLLCQTVQVPGLKCINPECQVTFGKFACLKCKLYQNRSTKINDIFHCDDCRMCRRGKRQDFFHCQICGYCRSISQKNKHKCSQNIALSACPICLQILKFSTKKYIALKCGHLIHIDCSAQYRSINCPVCGMALVKSSEDRNRQMDRLIEETRVNMPPELVDKKVDILCNECLHKSYGVGFHFFGVKCQGCGGYNTKMI